MQYVSNSKMTNIPNSPLFAPNGKLNAVTALKPTDGKLHFGHYIGNIQPLVTHQDKYNCYFIFADLQMLNEAKFTSQQVLRNCLSLMRQLIAFGIDPHKVVFCLESEIKKQRLGDFMFLSEYMTNTRIKRLPLFKHTQEPYKMSLLVYPILQALDFVSTNASFAFSNADNKPVIELINEMFSRVSSECAKRLPHIKLISGTVDYLPGFDGQKMSKSKKNCIFLDDDHDTIKKKVNKMYTDPNRVNSSVPGNTTNNIVFQTLKAFIDTDLYDSYTKKYQEGSIGDSTMKKILSSTLSNIIDGKLSLSLTDDALLNMLHEGNNSVTNSFSGLIQTA
jgi:tryptophanyl-tRNA synthetase